MIDIRWLNRRTGLHIILFIQVIKQQEELERREREAEEERLRQVRQFWSKF